MDDSANVLAGFVDEVTFAAEARISQRTSARYRKQPAIGRRSRSEPEIAIRLDGL